MYYEGTLTALREAVETQHPGTKAAHEFLPEDMRGYKVPLSYILWMCDQVAAMDTTSIDEALKAGRWMGWIFAHIELQGVWNNQTTRDLVRADRQAGLDRPH